MVSNLKAYTLRLHPGEDILETLLKYAKDHNLQAAFIMTCCGSVTKAKLRLAYKPAGEVKYILYNLI